MRNTLGRMEGPVGEQPARGGGIRLSRGTHLVIPAGSLTINVKTGETSISEIHLQREMYPVWIEIAISQLAPAKSAHEDVLVALEAADEEAISDALDRELTSGMLSMVAAATALDALYASVKEYICLPPSQVERWRKNRTARWRQVAEVLRLGFRVTRGAQAGKLRQMVKEVYHFRDLAVHPSSRAAQAVLHPDLGAGADWRYVSFSYNSALQTVWAVLAYIRDLSEFDFTKSPQAMQTLASDIKLMLASVYESWETTHGSLSRNPGL